MERIAKYGRNSKWGSRVLSHFVLFPFAVLAGSAGRRMASTTVLFLTINADRTKKKARIYFRVLIASHASSPSKQHSNIATTTKNISLVSCPTSSDRPVVHLGSSTNIDERKRSKRKKNKQDTKLPIN